MAELQDASAASAKRRVIDAAESLEKAGESQDSAGDSLVDAIDSIIDAMELADQQRCRQMSAQSLSKRLWEEDDLAQCMNLFLLPRRDVSAGDLAIVAESQIKRLKENAPLAATAVDIIQNYLDTVELMGDGSPMTVRLAADALLLPPMEAWDHVYMNLDTVNRLSFWFEGDAPQPPDIAEEIRKVRGLAGVVKKDYGIDIKPVLAKLRRNAEIFERFKLTPMARDPRFVGVPDALLIDLWKKVGEFGGTYPRVDANARKVGEPSAPPLEAAPVVPHEASVPDEAHAPAEASEPVAVDSRESEAAFARRAMPEAQPEPSVEPDMEVVRRPPPSRGGAVSRAHLNLVVQDKSFWGEKPANAAPPLKVKRKTSHHPGSEKKARELAVRMGMAAKDHIHWLGITYENNAKAVGASREEAKEAGDAAVAAHMARVAKKGHKGHAAG